VRGGDGGAVGKEDGEGWIGGHAVGNITGDVEIMTGGTGIGNDRGDRKRRGGSCEWGVVGVYFTTTGLLGCSHPTDS
jgi:hypothetical protein